MQGHPDDGHALPLKGVVLCSTSLDQDVRMLLAEVSTSMGAIHRLDLTTDVTHLIVGQLDTPKYKHVAKERPDIHVLKPDWIEAMRAAWTSGEEFDVQAIVEQHRLPAMYGLQICVTGFDDMDQRQQLMRSITEHGATYNGDLTKAVTHLIAKRPEGPKYDRAKQWGLRVVSLKWFEESLQRGMALEEALYDPLRPESMQGQGAFVRDFERKPTLGKRNRADAGDSFTGEKGKRKLRRTVSSRLNSHSQNLWAEMAAVDPTISIKKEDQWKEEDQPVGGVVSAPPEDTLTPGSTYTLSAGDSSRPVSRTANSLTEHSRGLFSHCLFQVMGHTERRYKKINEILQNEGGQIADSPENLYAAVASQSHDMTILVVPSEWTANTAEPLPDLPIDTWIVTEWWIERCIVTKTIIDPKGDVYSRPRLNMPNDCFSGMMIGSSGLGNDAKLVQSIVRSAGATYEEHFKPTCSVLIVRYPHANREKVAYAAKHGVPIVSEDWLQSSITQGQKLSIRPYHMSIDETGAATHNRGEGRPPEPPRRKDESAIQRLSVIRKRGVVPSLRLTKSHPNLSAPGADKMLKVEAKKNVAAPLPFNEEEASPVEENPNPVFANAQLDGPQPQPLQELPTRVMNSPKKRSPEGLTDTTQPPSAFIPNPECVEDSILARHSPKPIYTADDENTLPVDESFVQGSIDRRDDATPLLEKSTTNDNASESDKLRLSEDIRSLLERRKEAPVPAEAAVQGRKRKDRKLGRATSNMSNPSVSAQFMHSKSIEIADSTASASPLDLGVPIPSQQLGYETADAQEHRARMSKRMGTNLSDEGLGKRVASIGVVTDIDADNGRTGVGSRVRGRQRHAKA